MVLIIGTICIVIEYAIRAISIAGIVNVFVFGSSVPKPEITYGEFPISVVFEIAGEIRTVEDIVVCEFDGFEVRGEAGKYRKWKTYLKSGNKRLILLHDEDKDLIFEISMGYGLADYYMGDYTRNSKEAYETSRITDKYLGYVQWKDGVQTGTTISYDEAWEKYGLKILEVQYASPIQNTFN